MSGNVLNRHDRIVNSLCKRHSVVVQQCHRRKFWWSRRNVVVSRNINVMLISNNDETEGTKKNEEDDWVSLIRFNCFFSLAVVHRSGDWVLERVKITSDVRRNVKALRALSMESEMNQFILLIIIIFYHSLTARFETYAAI